MTSDHTTDSSNKKIKKQSETNADVVKSFASVAKELSTDDATPWLLPSDKPKQNDEMDWENMLDEEETTVLTLASKAPVTQIQLNSQSTESQKSFVKNHKSYDKQVHGKYQSRIQPQDHVIKPPIIASKLSVLSKEPKQTISNVEDKEYDDWGNMDD